MMVSIRFLLHQRMRSMLRQGIALRWFFEGMACTLLLTILGCSGDTGPTLTPVSGIITVDSVPLANASVSFRPDTAKGNKFAQFIPAGFTDQTGRYELSTTARKGAPSGWYKVVVTAPTAPPGGEFPKVAPPPFNMKFSDPDKTDLSIEVKDGLASGNYDLKLTK
jgi:hypothetical protein